MKKMVPIYLYTRYERFWHWLQAALIAVLLVTGFEVHGTFKLLGFEQAVKIHNWVGLTWLVAFAFGLLHGLGFAGALAEVGLPQTAVPLALASFKIAI